MSDKTLEELANDCATEIRKVPLGYASALMALFDTGEEDKAACEKAIVAKLASVIQPYLQSATAAQQREIENLQKAGDALADIVESLSAQLRTEQERVKKLAQLIWKTRWVSEDVDYQNLVGMAAEIESGHFTALDKALSTPPTSAGEGEEK